MLSILSISIYLLIFILIGVWNYFVFLFELKRTKKGGLTQNESREKIKGFINSKLIHRPLLLLLIPIVLCDTFLGVNLDKNIIILNNKDIKNSIFYYKTPFSNEKIFSHKIKTIHFKSDSSNYQTLDSFDIKFTVSLNYTLSDTGLIMFATNNMSDSSYKDFENNILIPRLKQECYSLFIKTYKEEFEHYPNVVMFRLKNILSEQKEININQINITDYEFLNKPLSIKKEFFIEVKNEELLDKKIEVQRKLKELKEIQIETFKQKNILDSILTKIDSL